MDHTTIGTTDVPIVVWFIVVWCIKLKQNARGGLSSFVLLFFFHVSLFIFALYFCMCACMCPCVFSIVKLASSSRLHRYPPPKQSKLANQYVIQYKSLSMLPYIETERATPVSRTIHEFW